MANSIILQSRYTTHQKIHMVLVLGAPFILIIVSLLGIDLNYIGYMVLLFFMLMYTVLICFAFTKRGLLKKDNQLYRCLYFKNKLIKKNKINLTAKPKVTILRFKRSQKMAWFSAAKPDLASEFNAFDITLLNDKHTKKEMLITLTNDDISKKTITYLEENFNLKHEVYSPDFS